MHLLCESGAHPDGERASAIATIHLTSGIEDNSYAVCAEHLQTYVRDIFIQQNLGPALPFHVWPLEVQEPSRAREDEHVSISSWLKHWGA